MAAGTARAAPAARPIASGAVLRIVLPKGSLERATLELFEAADLAVVRSSSRRVQGHDRRPAGRRGAHPAPAGDPGLRRRGPVRRRHHRARLDRGDGQRRRQPRRAALLEGDDATRSAWSSPSPATPPCTTPARPRRRRAGVVGVPRADPALLRQARHRRRRPPVLRRQRGQGPRHRRLRRRDHRDRPGAAGRRPADHRHHPRQLHRGHRQPRRPTRTRPSATPWAS